MNTKEKPDTSLMAKITRGDTTEEVAIEILRDGKDEMNLVEHPFGLLSLGTSESAVIDLSWEQRHPRTGKIVKSSWKVIGHPELGLPGPLEEKLYLVMMRLTRECGMQQIVPFSRGDLLRELGWSDNQRSYRQLEDAFARFKAVMVEAKNSFWNAASKSFQPATGFALIDNYDIVLEKPGPRAQGQLPLSSFRWNDVIFRSMTDGHLRSLDTTFALSLELPLALRLFRYLDKKRYGGLSSYEIDLRRLCEIHLGMTRNSYLSKYKERLSAAHEELLERGFLHGISYTPMKTKKGEKVRYEFKAHAAPDEEVLPAQPANDTGPQPDLLQRMLDLKVSPQAAEELLRTVNHDQLRIQLECLPDRDAKNPAAVFIKSVRELWALPPAYVARLEALEGATRAQQAAEAAEAAKAREKAVKRQKMDLAEEEAAQLDALWEKLDPKTRERLDTEAKKRLGPLALVGLSGNGGSPSGALAAMRRNLMREVLSDAATVVSEVE